MISDPSPETHVDAALPAESASVTQPERAGGRFRLWIVVATATALALAGGETARAAFDGAGVPLSVGESAQLVGLILLIGLACGVLIGFAQGLFAILVGIAADAAARTAADEKTAEKRRTLCYGITLAALFHVGALAAYAIAFDKIHRGINFIHRRLVDGVEYDLWPHRRPLSLVSLCLLPFTFAIVVVAARALKWRDAKGALGIGLTLIFGAGLLALDHANARFLVNLYRHVHLAIFAATFFFLEALLVFGLPRAVERVAATLGRRPIRIALAALLAMVGLHAWLGEDRSSESFLFMRTNSAREGIRLLRGFFDRDRDGVSSAFGGDDADDSNPRVGAWPTKVETTAEKVEPIPAAAQPTLASPVKRVVLVTIDALRADRLDSGDMPNLSRLAGRGARFDRCWSQAPFTKISFRSIFLSAHPCEIGATEQSSWSLPRVLGARGISTAGIAPRMFERIGFGRFGFARLETPADDSVERRTGKAITDAALRELASPAPAQFLWVHYFDPHSPYAADDDASADRDDFARYRDEVRSTDRELGRLLAALDEPSQKDTAIILSSDHGDEFGGHGGAHHGFTLYENALRVPFIVVAPGIAPRVVRTPIASIHIAPTVADLLHLTPPPEWRGRSILDLSRDGEIRPGQRLIVSETESGLVAFVHPSGRWKLIWHRLDGFSELYDLDLDPGERRNLIDIATDEALAMHALAAAWAHRRGIFEGIVAPHAAQAQTEAH